KLLRLPLQFPQTRDGRIALLVSEVVGVAAKPRQLLKVDEATPLRLKPLVLARGESRRLKLAHLEAERVRHVKLLGLVAPQRFQLAVERRPAAESRGQLLARGGEVCEGVEQFEVRVGV